MPRTLRRWIAALALLAPLAGGWSMSFAQAPFPTRAVRIIMPFPAGGLSDSLTRALAQELSKTWGQPVVVENRPGGAGVVATSLVAKSAPDGHSILMTNSALYLTTPVLLPTPPYDPLKDLVPAVSLARTSDVLLASLKSPIKSVQDLVEIARAKPDTLNYGSFGPGSATHLDMESLASVAGIKLVHIPYKGGVDVINALLAGEIDVGFTGLTPAIPLVEDGRLRAIGYNGPQRSPVLPNVPTLAESGLNGVLQGSWFALLVAPGTPDAVSGKIAADARQVLTRPAFVARFITGVGLEPLNLPAAEITKLMAVDLDSYAKLVRALDLHLQ
jgi:tripartite-type tricarboxylate transporter receptor subunit TctC